MENYRKPRTFFEVSPSPRSVTFDDGTHCKRNLPWVRFLEAVWDYSDPGTVQIEIGDWQVVICGHNLEQLFDAIATAQLESVRAHPEFADDPKHEDHAFATSISYVPLSALVPAAKEKPRRQLDLGLA